MLCIMIHFRIVFGYGQYDFNQNRIRIGYGYHFSKTGQDRIVTEKLTIRFAGWISGRIVSLQPDKEIQKLLSNGNRIRIRISETVLSIFRGFRLLEKVAHRTIRFIHYLQKHLFSLLHHDSESVNGVISEPQSYAKFVSMSGVAR